MGRRGDRNRRPAAATAQPKARPPEFAWAPGRVPPLAVAAAALFLLASALWVARPGAAYPAGVPHDWLVGGLAIAALAALVALAPAHSLRALPRSCARLLTRPSPATFAVIAGVTSLALSLGFAFYAFERSSSTSDEMAQLWHAKMLAHGRLSLPADPNPEFFAIDNVINAGRWYSEYPIGGPAALSLGVLLGVPWLVSPVLAGFAVIAMYHFARRAYGEAEGRAIAALFAVCPMFLMMAGTHMNHVPVLFVATCTLAALTEWTDAASRSRAISFAVLVGLGVGLMATIRPLDAVVFAIVVGILQLVVAWRERTRMAELVAVVAGGIVGVAPLLYVNWATTGNALRFGYEVLWGAGHWLGFHTDPLGNAHTLARAYEYAIMYVSELNLFALLWPVPVLIVATAGLMSMRRLTKWDALLLGLFWVQVLAYAAYWHQGQFLGPRFMFTALPAVLVFVARVPFLIGDRLGPFARRFVLAAVLGCLVATWLVPSWDYGVWGMARRDHDSRRVFKANYERVVRDANVGTALVFLRETFSSRLLHRLWGLGMPYSDAAQLFSKSDACSLLTAIRAAESDSAMPSRDKPAAVARATMPFVEGEANLTTSDPMIHVSSRESITDACRAELTDDARLGGAPFGPALPLEPIGPDGRVDSGDVVYVADLGERNERLRARFGNRKWYRLTVIRSGDKSLRPMLTPY